MCYKEGFLPWTSTSTIFNSQVRKRQIKLKTLLQVQEKNLSFFKTSVTDPQSNTNRLFIKIHFQIIHDKQWNDKWYSYMINSLPVILASIGYYQDMILAKEIVLSVKGYFFKRACYGWTKKWNQLLLSTKEAKLQRNT